MVKNKKLRKKINKEFNLTLKYVKESDNYIAITFGIFVFLFAVGFMIPFFAPPEVNSLIFEMVQQWIEEILEKIEGKGFLGMWWFIFQNNTMVALISIFSGVFFGIVPMVFLLTNGLVIGVVSGIISLSNGHIFSNLIRLVPHGIFEIPAIIISFAIGIRFGTFIFNKNIKKAFKYHLVNSARTFLFVILPLLFIAAIIESILIVFIG